MYDAENGNDSLYRYIKLASLRTGLFPVIFKE